MTKTRNDLAQYLDYTLLRPDASPAEIAALCAEAVDLNTVAVCVSPIMVRTAVKAVAGTPVAVASVVGFPSGAHQASVKAFEAALAVANGATEIDMVANLDLIARHEWAALESEIVTVRHSIEAQGNVVLKVILETALWSDEQIMMACRVAEAAGANFVKTSTGYHPAGGASINAVQLMASMVEGRLGVKASGGIRTAADVDAYLAAGATRVGTSNARAIIFGTENTSAY